MPSASARHPVRVWSRRILVALLALLVLAVAGFVVWAQAGVHAAEPGPLHAVEQDPAIRITQTADALVMTPAQGDEPETGLVFYPGAMVSADAYAARLSGLVTENHMTVVIAKPFLHLALFDRRPLDTFISQAPYAEHWIVGGHSMGGVRACQVADQVEGLLLMGSYCANNLSASHLAVLSLSGSEDHLSTPEKIADARHLLPSGARMVEIAGANHASFGDYGEQSADGTASISDAEMNRRVDETVGELVAQVA